jgi:hypothetical protein
MPRLEVAVVSGDDRPILLEPVEAAFDRIAAPISGPIEPRWTATCTAPATTVGLLIAALGNGRGDTPLSKVLPDRTRAE